MPDPARQVSGLSPDAAALPDVGDLAAPEARLSAAQWSELRHELRTPFNGIIGYAEMLSEDAADDGARQPAQAVVDQAHAVLSDLMESMSEVPGESTAWRLQAARQAAAAPTAELRAAVGRLHSAAAADAALPGDTPETLEKIDAAMAALESLLEQMPQWAPHGAGASDAVEAVATQGGGGEVEEAARIPGTPLRENAAGPAVILVVDDQANNRDLLAQRLAREGYTVRVAADGESALRMLQKDAVDLVLLDVMMPGMDGLEVLQRIKGSAKLKFIPVIMISALDEIERVVQCIESGAEDYLSKPFNPVLLRARIGVTLERKRLHDEEEQQRRRLSDAVTELAAEREKARRLLLNILPERVAEDLQQGHSAPMYFEDTTICFTDFVGFTLSTESMAAEQVVAELHTYFTAFDHVTERYGLEKLKTIGDSYMFASGLPKRHPANPVNAVLAAMELVEETRRLSQRPDAPGWQLRIGLHTGPVVAGVVGIRKFAFDIWGDSVNFASRMESSGAPGAINISERTYARVKDFFQCEPRGKVMTKDKREVDMFFVRGLQPSLIRDGSFTAFERRYKLYFSENPPALPAFMLSPRA